MTEGEELLQEELDDIRQDIALDCVKNIKYNWLQKGIIIEDNDEHKIINLAKVYVGYDELKSRGKVKEITIDESCDSLMQATEDDPDCSKLWNMLVYAAHAANYGLLVINISNIKVFGHCWKLKQLAKQEAPLQLLSGPEDTFYGYDTRFNFHGYVLIVLRGITFAEAAEYAEREINLSMYRAMMQYYSRYHIKDFSSKEELIKIGLSAIRNKDYTPRNDAETKRRFGIDAVWCNKTNLMGIITTKGEEVLPCVFDSVCIHLDFCIEAVFKGAQFDFCGIHRERGKKSSTFHNIVYYGETGAIQCWPPEDEDGEMPEDIVHELEKLLNLSLI